MPRKQQEKEMKQSQTCINKFFSQLEKPWTSKQLLLSSLLIFLFLLSSSYHLYTSSSSSSSSTLFLSTSIPPPSSTNPLLSHAQIEFGPPNLKFFWNREQFFVDRKRKLMYCYIHKNVCSKFKELFWKLIGIHQEMATKKT